MKLEPVNGTEVVVETLLWKKRYASGGNGSSIGFLECPDCHALVWAMFYGVNQNGEPAKEAHSEWHLRLQEKFNG